MAVAWLGPHVAEWSFGWRVVAYTAAWSVFNFALQFFLLILHEVLKAVGLLPKEVERKPTMNWIVYTVSSFAGCIYNCAGIGLVLAWYDPTPEKWTYMSSWSDLRDHHIMWIMGYQTLCDIAWDTYYYHMHRAMHLNKTIYRYSHYVHHKPSAIMTVLTTNYWDPLDAFLSGGLPFMLVAYIGCFHFHSYWLYAFPIYTMSVSAAMGHSGVVIHMNDLASWVHIALAPGLYLHGLMANYNTPMDHCNHHYDPRCNFAVNNTFWDDFYGTAKPRNIPHPIRLMALDLIFGFSHLFLLTQVIAGQPARWAGITLAWFLIPIRVQLLLLNPVTAWLSRLGLWDSIRALYQVTYASPGTPGAFQPQQGHRYIFCYHPQNIIARGAWYTFAGVGKQSPVACLPRVRLALGRWLMFFWGPALRAYGCCGSSWEELRRLLRDRRVATSVAITPDGFRSAQYPGQYALILNKRRGFVRLAHETGALLVPVLGIGEPFTLKGPYSKGCTFPKTFTPARVNPIQVVFGNPVAVAPGESMEATHKRYVAELLALGKRHGVLLEIVE